MNSISVSKTLRFGNIRYSHCYPDNPLEIHTNLKYTDRGPCFSAYLELWNPDRSCLAIGGSCLDNPAVMKAMKDNPDYMELVRLWKLYNLNGEHLGTPAQEAAIRESGYTGIRMPVIRCILESEGLLADRLPDGTVHTYGTPVYWPIPQEDLDSIRRIMRGTR